MSVKKVGQWKKAASILNNQAKKIEKEMEKVGHRLALKGQRIVLEHISDQDLPWEPLAETYRDKKRKDGHSDLIYVKTNSLFQGITGWYDGHEIVVGVKKGTLNADGEPLDVVAQTLEYGSRKINIPPRPLFEPSMEELHKLMPEYVEDAIKGLMKSWI